jgi:hypothetical protein
MADEEQLAILKRGVEAWPVRARARIDTLSVLPYRSAPRPLPCPHLCQLGPHPGGRPRSPNVLYVKPNDFRRPNSACQKAPL